MLTIHINNTNPLLILYSVHFFWLSCLWNYYHYCLFSGTPTILGHKRHVSRTSEFNFVILTIIHLWISTSYPQSTSQQSTSSYSANSVPSAVHPKQASSFSSSSPSSPPSTNVTPPLPIVPLVSLHVPRLWDVYLCTVDIEMWDLCRKIWIFVPPRWLRRLCRGGGLPPRIYFWSSSIPFWSVLCSFVFRYSVGLLLLIALQ